MPYARFTEKICELMIFFLNDIWFVCVIQLWIHESRAGLKKLLHCCSIHNFTRKKRVSGRSERSKLRLRPLPNCNSDSLQYLGHTHLWYCRRGSWMWWCCRTTRISSRGRAVSCALGGRSRTGSPPLWPRCSASRTIPECLISVSVTGLNLERKKILKHPCQPHSRRILPLNHRSSAATYLLCLEAPLFG